MKKDLNMILTEQKSTEQLVQIFKEITDKIPDVEPKHLFVAFAFALRHHKYSEQELRKVWITYENA